MKQAKIKDSTTAKAGYREGFITKPDYILESSRALLLSVDGKVYNCHPYHRDLGGFGIRWQLSDYEVSQLPRRQHALLGLIPFDPVNADTHSLSCECSLCSLFDEQPRAPKMYPWYGMRMSPHDRPLRIK